LVGSRGEAPCLEAKAKTDRIDAAALARLHAAGYLPKVWQPDERTELLCNMVSRRATIVQGMTRTKNRIHAVLHANLIPPFSGKLFMGPGRKWFPDLTHAFAQYRSIEPWVKAARTPARQSGASRAALIQARVHRVPTTDH
jgi:transposase